MMLFDGLRKPWWLAFVAVWLAVMAALHYYWNIASITTAGRIALPIAAAVALAVWFLLRDRFPSPEPAEANALRPARPARKPKAKRRR